MTWTRTASQSAAIPDVHGNDAIVRCSRDVDTSGLRQLRMCCVGEAGNMAGPRKSATDGVQESVAELLGRDEVDEEVDGVRHVREKEDNL